MNSPTWELTHDKKDKTVQTNKTYTKKTELLSKKQKMNVCFLTKKNKLEMNSLAMGKANWVLVHVSR